MRHLFYLVPVLFFSVGMSAQNTSGKIIYLDSTHNRTTEEKHVFYKIVGGYDASKEVYEITEYYKSGAIKAKATSTDKEGYKYAGLEEVYYENGNLKEKIYYKDGQRNGPYSRWYPNGEKWIQGSHFPNDKTEPKTTMLKIDQYWDENHIQQVIDGNGIYKEIEEKTTAFGPLKRGMKEGVWQGSDQKINIEFVETYENGHLISGVSIDENLVERNYTYVLKLATPKKGLQDFYNFIAKNFKVPEEDVSGKIILKFIVSKKGIVEDIEIMQGIEEQADLEAIRVVQKFSNWDIAQSRGIAVACSYTLPITITQAY